MRYWPDASVTTDLTLSIKAGLAASTRTPGRPPPELSLTTPVIAACAKTVDGRSSETRTNRRGHKDRWVRLGIAVLLTSWGSGRTPARGESGQEEYFICCSIRVRFVPDEEIDDVLVGVQTARIEGGRGVDGANGDRSQGRRRDVRQKKPAGFQHGFDIRHRQRLLEHVVVDQHVRGDHEVERLAAEALGHDVDVRHRHPLNLSRPRTNAPQLGQLRDCRRRLPRNRCADLIAEPLPVRAHLGEPRRAPRQRQVERIADVSRGPSAGPWHVLGGSRTDVGGPHLWPGRRRKTEPRERIGYRKRLQRLWRIEVQTDVLVCEVESGADDRYAFHGARFEQPARLHRRQRL